MQQRISSKVLVHEIRGYLLLTPALGTIKSTPETKVSLESVSESCTSGSCAFCCECLSGSECIFDGKKDSASLLLTACFQCAQAVASESGTVVRC